MSRSVEKVKRLLIVDDSEAIRHFLGRMFTDEGFYVDTAADGIVAQNLLGMSEYDIVLVDLRMPFMSGIELYRHIKKDYPEVANKVVFMSVDTPDPSMRNFFAKNNRPFLSKPFTTYELLKATGN